jgi:hypothetical protein
LQPCVAIVGDRVVVNKQRLVLEASGKMGRGDRQRPKQ